MKPIFLEIIMAPKFDEGALEVLCTKKNLRLLEVDMQQGDADSKPKAVDHVLQVPADQGEDDHAERGGARNDNAEQKVGAEIRRGERVQHVRVEYREDPGPVGGQRDDAQDHASRAIADEQVAGVAFGRRGALVAGSSCLS